MEAMRRLPVDWQIALELAYWEGMSGPEIAQVLAVQEKIPCAAGSARSACSAARRARVAVIRCDGRDHAASVTGHRTRVVTFGITGARAPIPTGVDRFMSTRKESVMHVSRPAIAVAILFVLSWLPAGGRRRQSIAGGGSDHADAIRREQDSSLSGVPLWIDPSGAIKAAVRVRRPPATSAASRSRSSSVEDTPGRHPADRRSARRRSRRGPDEFWSITGFLLAQLALVASSARRSTMLRQLAHDGKEHP